MLEIERIRVLPEADKYIIYDAFTSSRHQSWYKEASFQDIHYHNKDKLILQPSFLYNDIFIPRSRECYPRFWRELVEENIAKIIVVMYNFAGI